MKSYRKKPSRVSFGGIGWILLPGFLADRMAPQDQAAVNHLREEPPSAEVQPGGGR